MLGSKTSERVAVNTPEEINRRIECAIRESAEFYAGRPEEIAGRLQALDKEWDIERVLETNAAVFSLGGLILSIKQNRKWIILPLAVAGFLLQHAVQGWCPPLPVLRRLGIRTKEEILREKTVLRLLRGDFGELALGRGLSLDERIRQALQVTA